VGKIKLLKHVFALYSLPINFSEIYSLATLARILCSTKKLSQGRLSLSNPDDTSRSEQLLK